MARTLCVGCLLAVFGLASGQHLGLTVDTSDGTFKISHDGNTWLSGGEVQVAGLSAAAGTLKVRVYLSCAPPKKHIAPS